MDEIRTLNDLLQELRRRGVSPVKIASGYYIAKAKTDLLCKCDGDSDMVGIECPSCGAQAIVCGTCLDKGLITHCRQCTGVFSKRRRDAAKACGMTWEELEEELRTVKQHLDTPIDFDQLIAEGKWERVSATKYRLLVHPRELPKHVRLQFSKIEHTEVNDEVETIVEFKGDS